jgi:dipeptide/tripeptide permease
MKLKFNNGIAFNYTVITSAVAVLSSLAVGLSTGFLSFYLGRESLKGVTSPQENPAQKVNNEDNNGGQIKKFKLMKEQTMLVTVYDYIKKNREESKVKEKSGK